MDACRRYATWFVGVAYLKARLFACPPVSQPLKWQATVVKPLGQSFSLLVFELVSLLVFLEVRGKLKGVSSLCSLGS